MSNVLVGKTLTGIRIADDKMALLFQTTDGDLIVRVDADCCSHTWIESVENTVREFPAVVTSVDDIEMGKDGCWDEPECEYVQFYGCKIDTDRGSIIIDYRNSSNGYYGGSLSWPDDDSYFYGGVFGQNNSTENWIDLP